MPFQSHPALIRNQRPKYIGWSHFDTIFKIFFQVLASDLEGAKSLHTEASRIF